MSSSSIEGVGGSSSSTSSTNTTATDKSFSDRVNKTFGTLFASLSPSPSSLSNPLWSLTGSPVEKRQWRRDADTSARDSNPCSSAFHDFLSCARKNSKKNLQNYRNEFKEGDHAIPDDLVDEEDQEEEIDGGFGLDDWDLRASIGLDSTLDLEEEEDTYDKVALGRENAGDRLYMRDVNPNIISRDEPPCDTGKRNRDSRANRLAAIIRLKEDDAEAAGETEQHKSVKVPASAVNKSASSGDGIKVKPILKRKEHESTSKPSKHVRFDPDFISDSDIDANANEDRNPPETTTLISGSVLNEKISQVPDYVRNPSNYRRYSFDSDNEMNDKLNTEGYLGSLETVHESKNAGSESEREGLTDLPTPIAFVPNKKFNSNKADGAHSGSSYDHESDMKRCSVQSSLVAGIAAEEDLVTEVNDMDVDETETSAGPDGDTSSTKPARQYRTKAQADEPA